MAGRIKSVAGFAGTFHTADWPGGGLPDDQISFMLRFEDGTIGLIEGGTAQPTGMPASMFEIVGTEGGISIDHASLVVGRGVKESSGYAERFELRGPRGEVGLARAFLESICNNTPVPISAKDGRYAVEVCWAALQSAREGRVVHLPIPPNDYPTYSDSD
jgi:predicted dehydrogenase